METAERITLVAQPVLADFPAHGSRVEPAPSANHLYVVDVLRAFAALAVCLFHFGYSPSMRDSPLATLALSATSYGHLGVAVFFVISGFVIPLSMGNWRLSKRSLGMHLCRRLFRLYPPYVIASALSILLWWASSVSPGFQGTPLAFSVGDILANLTMTSSIFHRSWFLVVAWSLAIEVQFYIAIAFVLPLLLHKRSELRLLTMLAWVAMPLLPAGGAYFVEYGALFGMGMAVYLRRKNLLSRTEFVALVISAAAVQTFVESLASALASMATTAAMFTAPRPNKMIAALGAISYSLYLIHIPIGGRVINLGLRLPTFPGRWLLLMTTATLASILAAAVFYRIIEKPWIARSRAFRMESERRTSVIRK